MRFARILAPVFALSATVAAPGLAHAETERVTLGFGRLLTNDFLGDGEDRWRTSSYAVSWVRGPEWQGRRPTDPLDLIEHRFRLEIVAPSALNGPGSDDRAYAGILTYGMHTHYEASGAEVSAGVDLNIVGPQTGIDGLQDWFHDLIGEPLLGQDVRDAQVANAFFVSPVIEMAYPVRVSDTLTLRPFVEARAGLEEIVRVGADVMIGALGQDAMQVRDSVTGHLIRPVTQDQFGWGFVLGADAAMVGDSALFPDSFGTVAEDVTYRARAGAHWQAGETVTFFYGLTYLSEEYVGQTEGQVLGSVKLNFNF